MHRRAVVVPSGQHQHQHNDVEEHTNTNTNNNKHHHGVSSNPQKVRKRRKKKNLVIFGFTIDEDRLIDWIQIGCVIVLIGCSLALLSKWIFQIDSSLGDFFGFLSIWNWNWNWNLFGPRPDEHGRYARADLKPSSRYTIPDAMGHLGDKSDHYALLREEFDDPETFQNLPKYQPKLQFSPLPMVVVLDEEKGEAFAPGVAYDIYHCPKTPPQGYPFAWTLLDVLNHWPPDDPEPRPNVHQGLCVFDFVKDYETALIYREAELPFVVRNDPQVLNAVQRWNMAPDYMSRMLGNVRHRAEYSDNNHFLYWNMPPSEAKRRKQVKRDEHYGKTRNNQKSPRPIKQWQKKIEMPVNWVEPTQNMRMPYAEWLAHANVTDESGLLGPDMPHWYFRLIGCGETGPEGQCDKGSSEYLFDELPFFQPKESLYIVEPQQQKGIHCRFGMKGVIAENHFDGSRNMIAVLGGERRYILAHPDQCEFLSLLPKGHPSARHSAIDWSNPDLEEFPEFSMAKGNEVVLQAGDVLYLPTNWFHYIISLSLNFQCNTRSGLTQDYMAPIHNCGF